MTNKIHLVIPDVQDRPGEPKDHLTWIGKYIVDYKPNIVINLGDFTDMASLSSYDLGKKIIEGKRVKQDIESCREAMATLMQPLIKYNSLRRKHKKQQYRPGLHLTIGNHEERLDRLVNDDARLDGLVGYEDLGYEAYGWKVHDFLEIINIDGIAYSHYFYRPKSGRPYSGGIDTRLKNIGFSFTQGHEQGKMIGSHELADGTIRRGLIVGSCYLYNPEYRGPQAQSDWRGIIIKHEVNNGNYDLMEVSLDFLCRKYEQMTLKSFMKEKYNDK